MPVADDWMPLRLVDDLGETAPLCRRGQQLRLLTGLEAVPGRGIGVLRVGLHRRKVEDRLGPRVKDWLSFIGVRNTKSCRTRRPCASRVPTRRWSAPSTTALLEAITAPTVS